MINDPLARKLLDVLGNSTLSTLQKSYFILAAIRSETAPDRYPDYIRLVLESHGLVPRHETALAVETFDPSLVERVRNSTRLKVDYAVKGWFEINLDRPVERTMNDICIFLESWSDARERAVVFEQILSCKYVPIPVNFFSLFTDEASDNLILREHAPAYVQLRQMLNLKVGPTCRGSLIQEFLRPLADNPRAQAVVLGAFVDELLRRLREKKKPVSAKIGLGSNAIPLPIDLSSGNFKEIMARMQEMLPPEILEQLKKLFSQGEGDEPKA